MHELKSPRSRGMALIAASLAIMIMLAGCGASGNNGNGANGSSGAENAGSQSEAPASPTATAVDESGTRTMSDEFGEVELPANPQRIIALYMEDYLKALDVEPVAQWSHPDFGMQDYLELKAPTYDITGSIEGLLAFEPDLIIADGATDKAKYETYAKVAPTFRLPESVLQDPKQILMTIADVLGLKEEGEKFLAEYNAKIADAKSKLADSIGTETVAVVRLNIFDGTLALFGVKNRFVGSILYDELGLTPHPLVRDMEEFQIVLSEEAVPQLDADHIILLPSSGDWDSPENKEAMKALDSPLWTSLPAVKNGQVYQANRSYWQSGAVYSNLLKIDDMLGWMVK